NEYKLKEQICEIGRRVYNRGFAAANDGNITVRLNDKEVLCTPTMVSKGYMKCEDICKVDYDGKQLAGTRKRSSEVLLHLAIYKTRPDINGVRSEEHTSELQSRFDLVCRLLLEKKKNKISTTI